MIAGIVICHGDLARVILAAAETILGPAEAVYTYSNADMAPRLLVQEIEGLIERDGVMQAVVMVDLKGGSCWTAGRLLQHRHSDLRIVTGVNLPMLTSFLTKRQQLPLDELAAMLETDGRRGIVHDLPGRG